MAFYVYMLANQRNGTLYTGMTDDLVNRVRQHREKELIGWTAKYGVTRLVWYEVHDSRESAFTRERRIKKWYRAWKLGMIEKDNPEWRDLYGELFALDAPLHPDLAFLNEASPPASANTPPLPLIPAHAGIQTSVNSDEGGTASGKSLDPRVRGDERESME